jgi:hypothetical protein
MSYVRPNRRKLKFKLRAVGKAELKTLTALRYEYCPDRLVRNSVGDILGGHDALCFIVK